MGGGNTIQKNRDSGAKKENLSNCVKTFDICNAIKYNRKADWKRKRADMAQLVERVLGKDEVTGSIPVSSSMKKAIAKSNCFFSYIRLAASDIAVQ